MPPESLPADGSEQVNPVVDPVVEKLSHYLQNLDELWDLSHDEKDKLIPVVVSHLEDQLSSFPELYDEDFANEINLWLKALRRLDREESIDMQLRFGENFEDLLSRMDDDFESKSPPTLADFDLYMRQLYHMMGSQESPVLKRFCRKGIEKLDREMREFLHGNLTLIDDYLADRLDPIQPRVPGQRWASSDHKLVSVFRNVQGVDRAHPMKDDENQDLNLWSFSFVHDGETWNVEFLDLEGEYVTFVSADNPLKLATFNYDEIWEDLMNPDDSRFDRIVSVAEANFESEENERGVRDLEAWDFPLGSMSYIRVFPQDYDDVVTANLQSSSMMAYEFQQRYPGMEVEPPLFSDDPKVALREVISAAYNRTESPVRFFSLDLYNHGSSDSLNFKESLTADDIVDLSREFPEADFHVSTMACFGGGLRPGFERAFKDDPDLSSRISLFTQSKPNMVNYVPGSGTRTEGMEEHGYDFNIYSSFYYLYFMQALREDPLATYGEAAREADRRTKRTMLTDAEALINGKLVAQDVSRSGVDFLGVV